MPMNPTPSDSAQALADPVDGRPPCAPPAGPPDGQVIPIVAQLPLHVNARGLALGIIASVAFLFALQWAQKFLIPLVGGIFIAYTLNPLVNWLARRGIARAIGATIVTLGLLGAVVAVVPTLYVQFQAIVEELPTATHKLSHLVKQTLAHQPGTIGQMQAAASEIGLAAGAAPAGRSVRLARLDGGGFQVLDWVWAGSIGVLGFVAQALTVLFLVYFLLLTGDTFKRKLVKLTGPSLRQKKITVNILEEINSKIQGYMGMLLLTNVLLALLLWVALRLVGLQNAGAWAVAAGFFHIMPYIGPLLITGAIALVAFLQFESVNMVLLVVAISLGMATLVGTLVTTWMTGRIAKMNPAAVFVSLLFWGWLWGVWGMLLGVPIVVIVKVVAERLEGMEFVAQLLGD